MNIGRWPAGLDQLIFTTPMYKKDYQRDKNSNR